MKNNSLKHAYLTLDLLLTIATVGLEVVHQLDNRDLFIISRASAENSAPELKRAGANNVIMPDRIGGKRMAKLVALGTRQQIDQLTETISVETF